MSNPAKKGVYNIYSLHTGVLEHTSIFRAQSILILVKKWILLKYKTSPAPLLKQFFIAFPAPPPFLSLSLCLFFLLLLFLLLDSLLHPDLDDHLLPGLVHVHDDEQEVPDDGDGREILDHEY